MEAANESGPPTERQVVTKSTRDQSTMRADLHAWLQTKVDDEVTITSFEAPEANGMSSETILFDAEWDGTSNSLVMRLAPPNDSFPVFEKYDLSMQFNTMRLVGEMTSIPVPDVLWDEPSSDALGSPFFVMRRVDGIVPPDNLPYTFGSWITEATDDERATLVRSSLEVLAKLREIPDPMTNFALLIPEGGYGDETPLQRHFAETRRWLQWATDGEGSELLEEALQWLEANWPDETPTVVSWGDARIGNTMYNDFTPVAVLDWEMAALGPAELDLAWFIFLHRFFDDITTFMGMEGMPNFIRRADVEAIYTELTGHVPQGMDWYLLYSAVRHGIVFHRIGRRSAHFGEAEMPENPDDLIMHGATIRAMVDGTYWSSLG